VTNVVDALTAAEAGADLVGLMFYEKSPRNISIQTAAEIARSLPPFVVKVGVFVDPEPEKVLRAIADCGLNFLQFHGNETPEFCMQFGLMSMKAFRIRSEESLSLLTDYGTDAWLLDSSADEKLGGTGKTFDWKLAVAANKLGKPIFLAGGLTPDNVADAVRSVQPYGVDVSSGVEKSPGKKDPAKVRAFIKAARTASA
jgi:phosphoribosylanthranilate isomerase